MKASKQARDPAASVRSYLIGASALVILLFGGVGTWAAMASIAGAVFAQGELIIEGRSHHVQHPDGGIIEDVTVRDGDVVERGDILFSLDPTQLQASHAILSLQVTEHQVRRQRLLAERDGEDVVSFPVALSNSDDPVAIELMRSEEALFEARRTFMQGQQSQLRQRIVQIGDQIAGLQAQERAKVTEIALIEEELNALQDLMDQGLVQNSRLLALQRNAAQLGGERGAFVAQIAQARGQVSEIELQILSMINDRQTQVLGELNATNSALAELTEELGDVAQRMDRLVARAPLNGIIHELEVTSQGALVSAERTVLQIVPVQNALIIEARIAPQDVDQVSIGTAATLRFSAFNQRTTPELTGAIVHLSADRSIDEQSGQIWYIARLSVSDEEMARLGQDVEPLPGMPVDVLIQTSERSVLSFLVKPISDHIVRAFIEE